MAAQQKLTDQLMQDILQQECPERVLMDNRFLAVTSDLAREAEASAIEPLFSSSEDEQALTASRETVGDSREAPGDAATGLASLQPLLNLRSFSGREDEDFHFLRLRLRMLRKRCLFNALVGALAESRQMSEAAAARVAHGKDSKQGEKPLKELEEASCESRCVSLLSGMASALLSTLRETSTEALGKGVEALHDQVDLLVQPLSLIDPQGVSRRTDDSLNDVTKRLASYAWSDVGMSGDVDEDELGARDGQDFHRVQTHALVALFKIGLGRAHLDTMLETALHLLKNNVRSLDRIAACVESLSTFRLTCTTTDLAASSAPGQPAKTAAKQESPNANPARAREALLLANGELQKLEGSNVVDLAAGADFVASKTSDGTVALHTSSGSEAAVVTGVAALASRSPQLAVLTNSGRVLFPRDAERQRRLPQEILFEQRVYQVSCGEGHSLLVTFSGACFAIGDNRHGQCGLAPSGKEIQRLQQVQSANEDTFVSASAGRWHSLFVTRDGRCLSCGLNDKGQLGLNEHVRIVTQPEEIHFGDDEAVVVSALAGWSHSLFLVKREHGDEGGDVYCAGSNQYGQLGAGHKGLFVIKPTKVERYDNSHSSKLVTAIACGGDYNIVSTVNGQVYIWGRNFNRSIFGTKLMTNTPYPKRIHSPLLDNIQVEKIVAHGTQVAFLVHAESSHDIPKHPHAEEASFHVNVALSVAKTPTQGLDLDPPSPEQPDDGLTALDPLQIIAQADITSSQGKRSSLSVLTVLLANLDRLLRPLGPVEDTCVYRTLGIELPSEQIASVRAQGDWFAPTPTTFRWLCSLLEESAAWLERDASTMATYCTIACVRLIKYCLHRRLSGLVVSSEVSLSLRTTLYNVAHMESESLQLEAVDAIGIGFQMLYPSSTEQASFLSQLLLNDSTPATSDSAVSVDTLLMTMQLSKCTSPTFWSELLVNADESSGKEFQAVTQLIEKLSKLLSISITKEIRSQSSAGAEEKDKLAHALFSIQRILIVDVMEHRLTLSSTAVPLRASTGREVIIQCYVTAIVGCIADVIEEIQRTENRDDALLAVQVAENSRLSYMLQAVVIGLGSLEVDTAIALTARMELVKLVSLLDRVISHLFTLKPPYKAVWLEDLHRDIVVSLSDAAFTLMNKPASGAQAKPHVVHWTTAKIMQNGCAVEGPFNEEQVESEILADVEKFCDGTHAIVMAVQQRSPISGMNKMKFRNKEGEANVWRAFRVAFLTLHAFAPVADWLDDASGEAAVKSWRMAMKLLTWMNHKRQKYFELSYIDIGLQLERRCRFLLFNVLPRSILQAFLCHASPKDGMVDATPTNVTQKDIVDFLQEDADDGGLGDVSDLEKEIVDQIEVVHRRETALRLFSRLLDGLHQAGMRRYAVFRVRKSLESFSSNRLFGDMSLCSNAVRRKLMTEFATMAVCMLRPLGEGKVLQENRDAFGIYELLVVQSLDACLFLFSGEQLEAIRTAGLLDALVELLQPMIQWEYIAKLVVDRQTATTGVCRLAQFVDWVVPAHWLPRTHDIQWCGKYKHPSLVLSHRGQRVYCPAQLPTAATLRSAQSVRSGQHYVEVELVSFGGTETDELASGDGDLAVVALGLTALNDTAWDAYGVCGMVNRVVQTLNRVGDTIGCYLDMDERYCTFYRVPSQARVDTRRVLNEEDVIASQLILLAQETPDIFFATSILSPGITTHTTFIPNAKDLVKRFGQHYNVSRSLYRYGQHQQNLPSEDRSQAPAEAADQDAKATNTGVMLCVVAPKAGSFIEEPELYVCGQNTYHELGLGDSKPRNELIPSAAVKGLFPVQVVAGNEVTAILDTNGNVYVWGYNVNGSCAHKPPGSKSAPSRVMTPRLVRALQNKLVRRICCSNGSEHVFAITSTGELWGWGFNKYGQLGIGHKTEAIFEPTRVSGHLRDKAVHHVANSYSHSVALTTEGLLFGFGLNSRGQLGLGSSENMWTLPQAIKSLARKGRALSVAAGVEHTAVVMESGSVYTFGRNDSGQLGIDDRHRKISEYPVLVEDGLSRLRGLRCTAVACGYYFTVVLAEGKLHSFGCNDFGQLGLGHTSSTFAPAPVLTADDDEFVALSCGTGHTVAVTTDGRVISWGRNKVGAVGNGSSTDHPFPVEIGNRGDAAVNIRGNRVFCVAAGFHHTALLSAAVHREDTEQRIYDMQPTADWHLRTFAASWAAFRVILRLDKRASAHLVEFLLDAVTVIGNGQNGVIHAPCPLHAAYPIQGCCLSESVDHCEASLVGIIRLEIEALPEQYFVVYTNMLLNGFVDILRDATSLCEDLAHNERLIRALLRLVHQPLAGIGGRAIHALQLILPFAMVGPMDDIMCSIAKEIDETLIVGRDKVMVKACLITIGRAAVAPEGFAEQHWDMDETAMMAVSQDLIGLLRVLMQWGTKPGSWGHCINTVLEKSLCYITELPDELQAIALDYLFLRGSSTLDATGIVKNPPQSPSLRLEDLQSLWLLSGTLAVLGGNIEMLRGGGLAKVVMNDADRGQLGQVLRYRKGASDMVKLRLLKGSVTETAGSPNAETVVVRRVSSLIPIARIGIPVDSLLDPSKLFALLVRLVNQVVELPAIELFVREEKTLGSDEDLVRVLQDSTSVHLRESATYAAALHEQLKARACIAIDELLLNHPRLVNTFVEDGHLQAVASLLAAPKGRLDDTNINILHRRVIALELHRRRAFASALTPRPSAAPEPDANTSSPAPEWTCPDCTYKNLYTSPACAMCFSQKQAKAGGESGTLQPAFRERKKATSRFIVAASETQSDAMEKVRLRSVSSAKIEHVQGEVSAGAVGDVLSRSWWFKGHIYRRRQGSLRAERNEWENGAFDAKREFNSPTADPVWTDDEGQEKQVLCIGPGFHVRVDHACGGNGSPSSVYLNQYTLLLDARFNELDGNNEHFIPLVQSSIQNDDFADWYVKGDGSVGCLSYSEPGVVQAMKWHRLALVVDLLHDKTVRFYVDGELVATLNDQPNGPVPLLEDDRWALDSYFYLFWDKEDPLPINIHVRAFQLRRYPMSSNEVSALGVCSPEGISSPTLGSVAQRLEAELNTPYAWCVKALEACRFDLEAAKHWLEGNAKSLIVRSVTEARMLTAMGFQMDACVYALCISTSLQEAISWLIDNAAWTSMKHSTLVRTRLKAVLGESGTRRELLKESDGDDFFGDQLMIGLAEDVNECQNRTYEIFPASDVNTLTFYRESTSGNVWDTSGSIPNSGAASSPAVANAVAVSTPKSYFIGIPAVGSGLRQLHAELWESARQLYVSHARRATVSILESSLVSTGNRRVNGEGITPQQLLGNETMEGRLFLRNYLRAFPESIRRDVRSATGVVDKNDPIQVLRRKLLNVFQDEVAQVHDKVIRPNTMAPYESLLQAWWSATGDHPQCMLHKFIGDDVWMWKGPSTSILPAVITGMQVDVNIKITQGSRSFYYARVSRDLWRGNYKVSQGSQVFVKEVLDTGWAHAVEPASGRELLLPEEILEREEGKEVFQSTVYGPVQVELEMELEEDGEEQKKTEEVVLASEVRKIMPPSDPADSRLQYGMKAIAEKREWERSVVRTISEDVLHELIMLARGPWKYLPGGLQAGPSVQFRFVWNDASSSKDQSKKGKKADKKQKDGLPTVHIYRPLADSGFSILGDVALTSVDNGPSVAAPVTVVSDDDGMGGKSTTASGEALLAEPVGYKLLWQNGDSNHVSSVSIWQPIAPKGYVALGCIAIAGIPKQPPTKRDGLHQLRCVHRSCVFPSTLKQGLWSLGETGGNAKNDTKSQDGNPQTVSFWEVESSARTFCLQLKAGDDDAKRVEGKGFRVDAPEIEMQLLQGRDDRKESEEQPEGMELNAEGNGLKPFHLGLASTNHTEYLNGSSDLALWILQLLSELDSRGRGAGIWAKRIFSPQIVHAVLRFSRTATAEVRNRALRMLAAVIRRTPPSALTGSIRNELGVLCEQMEKLYRSQTVKSGDEAMDEMPLFSSLLCALVEVFVSVSLTNRHESGLNASDPSAHLRTGILPDDLMRRVEDVEASLGAVEDNYKTLSVVFDKALDVEILSNKSVLIVHTVKPGGAASCHGVLPGDVFWKLQGKSLREYDKNELWDIVKSTRPLSVTLVRPPKDKKPSSTNKASTSSNSPSPYKKLSSSELWFEEISELASIMEALLNRGTVEMPAEFLMAEDTFLKLILSNRSPVESAHPHSDKGVTGDISIPGAEALVVRFDRRCATKFGKALQLSCEIELNAGGSSGEGKGSGTTAFVPLETLQGNFGSCSVLVPSNKVRYTFPVVSQLDWFLHKNSEFKADGIKVSSNGRVASLKKDKVWQTVFATTGFRSGINMWEVRIDKTGPSANIFFGVAFKSAKVDNYLGCDDKGWGWIGCMACWHGGRKVRHRFGKRLKANDIVRITLDIPRRAISLACNGEDWGVAFNKLPLPSTVQIPGNELVPAFSFYNRDDQITLLSGSGSQNPHISSILYGMRSKLQQQQQHRPVARLAPPSTTSRQATSRPSRTARRSTSSSSFALPRLRSRNRSRISETGQDEQTTQAGVEASATGASSRAQGGGSSRSHTSLRHVPPSRLEDAETLAALGYPLEWCIQALEETNDDVNSSAEYLINNADRLEQESEQEAARVAVEIKQQIVIEEEEWLNHVSKILVPAMNDKIANNEMHNVGPEKIENLVRRADAFGINTLSTDPTSAEGGVRRSASSSSLVRAASEGIKLSNMSNSTAMVSTRKITSEVEQEAMGLSPRKEARSANEWGYRMTISPLFSRETSKRLAKESTNALKLKVFHEMFEAFTLEQDCKLVEMINGICANRGDDPLTLSPSDIAPSALDRAKFPRLADVPLLTLQLRFMLLRNFNRRLSNVLPLIDLSCADYESFLASNLRALRGVIMSSVKR